MKLKTIFVALVITTAAYAEKPTRPKSKLPKAAMQGGLFEDINLTKDQQKKIAVIMKAEREEMKKQMKELRDNRKAQKGNKSTKIDMKDLREKMKARKETLNTAIKAILTPEQLTVFKAKMEERKVNLPKFIPSGDKGKPKK